MASDLISRDALMEDCLKRLSRLDISAFEFEHCFPYWIFHEAITEAPAVDAVEVVRCKDCKLGKRPTVCERLGTVVKPNDFCSYGVKEDAAD